MATQAEHRKVRRRLALALAFAAPVFGGLGTSRLLYGDADWGGLIFFLPISFVAYFSLKSGYKRRDEAADASA